uniref:Lipocalin n=1 Tax=Rhipicephalus zambeziensis TaxID=60191 RepID=A0A224YCD6_9ACAR
MLTFTAVLSILGAGAVSVAIKGAPSHCKENDDGWAFMTDSSAMFMTERNFNTDPQNRDLTKCVSARTVKKDEETHIFRQMITYYNTTSRKWITFPKVFTAKAWGTGSKEINYFTAPGPNGIPLTYLVLHVEVDCLVAKLLYRSNAKLRACEVWVRKSYFDHSKSSKCCDHFYHISCDKTVQTFYKKKLCSRKEKTKKD